MVPDASLLGTKHEGEVPFDILASCLGGMLPHATETEDGSTKGNYLLEYYL